jgi:hypothetical protein
MELERDVEHLLLPRHQRRPELHRDLRRRAAERPALREPAASPS